MQQIIFIAHRQASNYQLPTTRNRSAGSAGCCDADVAELQIDALGQFSLHYTLLLQLPVPSLRSSLSLAFFFFFLATLATIFHGIFSSPFATINSQVLPKQQNMQQQVTFLAGIQRGAEVRGGSMVDLRFPAAVCCQRANYKLRPLAIDGVAGRCRAPFACLI